MANLMSQSFHEPLRSRWRDVCHGIDYTKLQTDPLKESNNYRAAQKSRRALYVPKDLY